MNKNLFFKERHFFWKETEFFTPNHYEVLLLAIKNWNNKRKYQPQIQNKNNKIKWEKIKIGNV